MPLHRVFIAKCSMRRTRLLCGGRALFRLVVAIPVAILVVGFSWFVYAEYRRNYWDDRVRELCGREGGIKVFERAILRDPRYLDAEMNIRIPAKLERQPGYGPSSFEAKPEDIFFRQTVTTVIRDQSPRVARDDIFIVRNGDQKVLGQATSFGRVGGDFLAVDFESRFRCPIDASESHLMKRVFIVEVRSGEK